MNVLIQFDDQNTDLAVCIGTALKNYGTARSLMNEPNGMQDMKLKDPVPTLPLAPGPGALGDPSMPGSNRVKLPDRVIGDPAVNEPAETCDDPHAIKIDHGVVTPLTPLETSEQGGGQLDVGNVPFDAAYCAKARDPFYKSGKRKGQWKRRQGVDAEKYDLWYAGQVLDELAEMPCADTTAAFGGPPAASPPAASPPAASQPVASQPVASQPPLVDESDVPQGAGELMRWVSEQMNAGNLTQADVDAAYATADVTPAQLFSDDSDAVASLYGVLQGSIPA